MIIQSTVWQFIHSQNQDTVCPIWDVRDPNSFAQGHIQGAVNVPLDTICAAHVVGLSRVAVLCGGGTKAGRAIEKLLALGFLGDIIHLIDGTRGAVASGMELIGEND